MKLWSCALGLVLVGGSLSCGGNNAGPSTGGERTLMSRSGGAAANLDAPAGTGRRAAAAAGITIPKDARWTIYCTHFTGPDHAARAKTLRDQLLGSSGMSDWYVVTGEDRSTVYHGYYRSINDPADGKESARAQNDRKAVAAVAQRMLGARAMASALLVELDDADPASAPEWDLRNAKGFWSIQVASFRDHSDRREAAVQAVRDLRAQGYEAYYFHGPAISSVCVGAFPREAVKEQQSGTARPVTAGQDEVLLVAPDSVKLKEGMRTPDGRPITVVQKKVEIQDGRMLDVFKKFPYHAENYVEGKRIRTPQGEREVKRPSFLVFIPQKAQPVRDALMESPVQTANRPVEEVGPALDPRPLDTRDNAAPIGRKPAQPAAPKGGRLKSLED